MSQKKTLLLLLDEYAGKPFGWGGGEELPIRQDSVDLCRYLLHDDEFPSSLLEQCSASIIANDNGTIEVLADHGDRSLFLIFHCGSAVGFVQLFNQDYGTCIDGLIRIVNPGDSVSAVRQINDLFEWLVKRTVD